MENTEQRRVTVIQQGARRNYIYARLLEADGLLRNLICDTAWPAGHIPWYVRTFAQLVPSMAGPLARRVVGMVDPKRVKACFLPNVARFVKYLVHEEKAYAIIDEALAWSCGMNAVSGADVVLNYQGNGGSLLQRAKGRGAVIVTDFIITPLNKEIEAEEQRNWPGWETTAVTQREMAFYRRRVTRILEISDLYLCPSQSVARDLANLPSFDSRKARIVPYGLSGVLKRRPQPELGRVLFAGTAGLRKGIPYLAEAARILKQRKTGIDIVVAGAVSSTIRFRPETRDLIFLGKLDREQMADEFARADIFCLPSLAEGSATVIFEAMAFGIPIVTTISSGSVVENGVEGYIVPERDGKATADAIERIYSNRERRGEMSKAALRTAVRYSDENCGAMFIKVIRDLLNAIDEQSATR